jgi:S1-C subfamily serine protease
MFQRASLAFFMVVAAATARAEDAPNANQRASIFAKGSVVRVIGYWEVKYTIGKDVITEYVGGTGSGFFASGDGFVVTNAHVVADIQAGEAYAKEQALTQLFGKLKKQFAEELAVMSDEERYQVLRTLAESSVATPNASIVLPDGTKVPYVIKVAGKPGEGTDVAIIKTELKDTPNLPIADSARVQIQDKVLAIGYPGAADMQGLLDDKSQLEATINEGAVSAIKRTSAGDPIIQISASITHGNSGGPTINDKGEVIGLSTFGSTGEVQGFNFIVGSATVKKFLDEAKVNTTPSQTTTLWRKGLDEYWDLDLDAAIADFEEVMTLFPTHSEAPHVLKLARALKKEGKGKIKKAPELAAAGTAGSANGTTTTSSEGGGAGAAVAVIVLGIVGIGVVVLVRRSKKARAHAQPAPGMPHALGVNAHQGAQLPPHHGAAPHGHHGPPLMPAPQGGPMMGPGRAVQPVAKTMAINNQVPAGNGQLAKTSLGSMTIGVLTCTRGRLHGQRFSLTVQGLLIGRQPGVAQIVIDDPRSSGKHVWIGYEQGQLVAIDQGTTNGTFVNDVRYGRISKAVLKNGDTVIVSEPDCLSLTLQLS